MASILNEIPQIVAVLQKGAAFEAGQPITIIVPSETYTVPIPEIGSVTVSESGLTIVIKKD